MGISKFHQSCGGYGTAQNQFEHTNKDSHLFSTEILKVLKKYCEIPENQFSIYSIDEGNGFQLVRPALMNAIEVKLDKLLAFWRWLNGK